MRALSTAASVVRHSLGAAGEALLLAAVIAALIFGAAVVTGSAPAGARDALAGRGVITVPDGVFGGTTTATVNPGGTDVWAYARCSQGGSLVYEEYVRVDANKQATFTLGPTPLWSGGDADCVAEEGYWSKSNRWRTVATTTFHVDG